VDSREAIPGAIEAHLVGLAMQASGSSVDVLGRYRFDEQLVPRRRFPQLKVTFRTVHGSKGLEADHIILPNLGTALLAGGMLAFALSFDEVIVTTFTAGQQATLPIWIFSQLTRPRDRPVTNVVALFVIAITFIPILLAHRLTQGAGETSGGRM
jgi:hypothetical protein